MIQPLVPEWIAPRGDRLIQGFYEGLPEGAPIPWHGWLESLSYWLLFLLSLYLVSICLMVMLRKQWVEGERLLYPMMQAPIELVATDPRPDGTTGIATIITPILRQPLFWLGFAVPAAIGSINGFAFYHTYIPNIDLASSFSVSDTITIPWSCPSHCSDSPTSSANHSDSVSGCSIC